MPYVGLGWIPGHLVTPDTVHAAKKDIKHIANADILIFLLNYDEQHWALLLVNQIDGRIYYADSNWTPDCDALFADAIKSLWQWYYHVGAPLDPPGIIGSSAYVVNTTQQEDGFTCGLWVAEWTRTVLHLGVLSPSSLGLIKKTIRGGKGIVINPFIAGIKEESDTALVCLELPQGSTFKGLQIKTLGTWGNVIHNDYDVTNIKDYSLFTSSIEFRNKPNSPAHRADDTFKDTQAPVDPSMALERTQRTPSLRETSF
ncbi:uncharacterized protein LY79DRAFT_564735 [Colletotrichum navitas]|uniref:Ubiquitin-like protease family profile domain-containing protein n=1 Tax=Colletotrichum navitas TaxID=681940 RepID=A0AAD8V0L2_9PEZI|nr:uncharacterized protein LY79DRAFT_564735 [Colletotrichum navitas]KAK1579231.1 hypothetical protein LY79DRAFT_564735 [Colletotrichum navitas]